ncbi:alpha-amylase family glycosyl hydrolase [Hymenobacter puniceus]|uniref:alpha-amylase family glycosyl hydrolase n=1 Tax=Hymenobacter sp. BT190 TaxID=2763505 RepID=UPI001650DA41|nr:alpha-amylase family glycosyl hydrolase [Hymenobacter sp. BT190]MBC6698686.1 alpha-glucosidase C-terminal domain-containing protein [Hymenobacter sp. BT190]
MSLFINSYRASLALVLAAGLLGACKSSGSDDPAPTPPTTNPGTPTTPQYGTPFAGVPNREDAVMYQVNMRAFSQSGNFAGVTARLDSIRDLGVNVLYLMPIYPIGTDSKSVNSPYAVKDYRAVNTEFGSLTDLRALVDGAHQRNMAVMLDWVANHTSWDHAWITQHPDWYQKNAAGAITPVSNNGTTYNDVAQLNFTNAAMRLEMISALKSWVYTANVDGFRFDYADFQPNDFWKQATDTLRNIKSHKLLLLAEGTRPANFSSGFDYNFGFNWYGGIYQVYKNGANAANTFDALNTSEYNGATGTQQVVRYITNHDVNGSDGTPVTLFGGRDGAMSAFVITALYKGVPMIYNGQETGMSQAIPFPFTSVKVRWGQNPDVKRAYKQLLAARAGSVALRVGTPTPLTTRNVCAFTKTAGSEQAFVVANVRNSPQVYTLPANLANTTWTDALTGNSVALNTQISLPAYGYLVLKK